MSKIGYFWGMFLLAIAFALTAPYALYILKTVFLPETISIWRQLECFMWVTVGVIAYVVIKRYVKHNIKFLETHAHEWTHAFFALLFNRRIHSLYAKNDTGVVFYEGGKHDWLDIPISLAPYCFPMFTWLLLSIRFLLNFNGMWIYDILIGLTIGFHFLCIKSQIGNYQTDINQYPLSFSYFYIVTMWLINFCIITVAFFPNMNGFGTGSEYEYGLWSSVFRLGEEWWKNINVFIVKLF